MAGGYDAGGRPPQGDSGSKTLLIVLSVIGVLLLVCCGAGIGAFWFVGRQVQQLAQNLAINDPAQIRALTSEITAIDVPQELEPKLAMNMRIPVTNQPMMKMAHYGTDDNSSSLVLSEFNDQYAQQQGSGQLDQTFTEGVRSPDNKTEVDVVQRQIRGQPATFRIWRGESDSGEMWQVDGTFRGKGGQAQLLLIVPTDTFDRARIDAVIESIE